MRQILTFADFLDGLDGPDTFAVGQDIMLYGNAFVEALDGKKRRLPLERWPSVIAPSPDDEATA